MTGYNKTVKDHEATAKALAEHLLDANALMLTKSPQRPDCCVRCEFSFIQNSLQALALSYARSSAEQREGKTNDPKPR